MTTLYKKLKRKNLRFDHVCEVGVYLPEYSNIIDFIREGIRATLVEADPVTVEKIRDYYRDYNVTVYPFAVWDHDGFITLSKADASTFVTSLAGSPAIVNDHFHVEESETFQVACKKFSELDDGHIDLLSVDIEGSEWYVIKHLVSRPRIISVETHGKYYTNPFITEILSWMQELDYMIWYKDRSDTVFVHKKVFLPGFRDKLNTRLQEGIITWKKFKRIFKKKK
jgi:FkbM family methyltransferase